VRVARVKGATGDDDFDEDPASVEYQEVTWQESSLPRVNGGMARGVGKQRVANQGVGGLGGQCWGRVEGGATPCGGPSSGRGWPGAGCSQRRMTVLTVRNAARR